MAQNQLLSNQILDENSVVRQQIESLLSREFSEQERNLQMQMLNIAVMMNGIGLFPSNSGLVAVFTNPDVDSIQIELLSIMLDIPISSDNFTQIGNELFVLNYDFPEALDISTLTDICGQIMISITNHLGAQQMGVSISEYYRIIERIKVEALEITPGNT